MKTFITNDMIAKARRLEHDRYWSHLAFLMTRFDSDIWGTKAWLEMCDLLLEQALLWADPSHLTCEWLQGHNAAN